MKGHRNCPNGGARAKEPCQIADRLTAPEAQRGCCKPAGILFVIRAAVRTKVAGLARVLAEGA